MTSAATAAPLRELARLVGVQASYTDGFGRRRGARQEALVAVLRALGAGRAQVVALFAASALVLAAAAAPIGILVERFALAPEVARLAVSYVALPLGAGRDAIMPVLAVLVGGAIAAAAWAAHAALRVPVAAGLREE
jgi:predicted lysophospholipase L1 biosynthesis ABC-type transport system permease subunit